MHDAGDANAAGVGEAFQPRRNVHPVAVNLLTLDHHVAKVHSYPELHSSLGCDARVLCLESGLDLYGAVHRVYHAGELGEHAVARGVDETAAMILDETVDDFAIG